MATGKQPWEMTGKAYRQYAFQGQDPEPIGYVDIWSDPASLRETAARRKAKDGIHIADPYVYRVEKGKPIILPDLHAVFDYDTGEYRVSRRPPSDSPERQILYHGTPAPIKDVRELRPGSSFGRSGFNEYLGVYMTSDPDTASLFGDNLITARLVPGSRIVSRAEADSIGSKAPEGMTEADALRAEGIDGVGSKDPRGDWSEIAILNPAALEPFNPHREAVQQALASGEAVPDSVLAEYPDIPKTKPQQPATLVGWRQGVVEPKVDLHEGDVFYTGDDPRIPNDGKPSETFTVLLRGPEDTAPQDIDMGIFVAEVDGQGVKYTANAKGRELRRTPPKRKIKKPEKRKKQRVYAPSVASMKTGKKGG